MSTEISQVNKASAFADELAQEHPVIHRFSLGKMVKDTTPGSRSGYTIEAHLNDSSFHIEVYELAQDIANYPTKYTVDALEKLNERSYGMISSIKAQPADKMQPIPADILDCADDLEDDDEDFEDEEEDDKSLRFSELTSNGLYVKDCDGNVHSFRLTKIIQENAGLFIVIEEDGKYRKVTEVDAIIQASQNLPEEQFLEVEEEIQLNKRCWEIDNGWPNGGKFPIDSHTFTPDAAKAFGLIDSKAKIDKDATVKYLTDRVEFAKIQKGNSCEDDEPVSNLYYYRDGYYRPGAISLVAEMLERLFPEECTNALVKEIAGDGKVAGKIGRRCKLVKSANLDQDGWRCLNNCIVRLPTIYNGGKLITAPHTPNKFFTKKYPIYYDKDSKCPNIEEFFKQVSSSKEMEQGLVETITWLMTPGYEHPWIMFLVGEGSNGKSIYLRLIWALLGSGYCTSIPLHSLADEDDKFRRAHLYGKCVNMSEDIGHDTIRTSGEIKNLSGGGKVFGEIKYGGMFEFQNEAKLIFSTNRPPIINDDSYGINRRVRSFAWEKQFLGKDADPGLFKKLATPSNLSGLFNLAVASFATLEQRGELSGVRIGIDVLHKDADSTKMFIENECEVYNYNVHEGDRESFQVDRDELFTKYKEWCEQEKVAAPLGKNTFLDEVRRWNKINKHSIDESQVTFSGKRVRVFMGIKCHFVKRSLKSFEKK